MKTQPNESFHKAYVVGADGSKTPLAGRAIVIELGPDLEIEVDLAAHPAFAGVTIYAGRMKRMEKVPTGPFFSSRLIVHPSAANVIGVSVERRLVEVAPDTPPPRPN